jgi:hypothetical protein
MYLLLRQALQILTQLAPRRTGVPTNDEELSSWTPR